MDRLRKLVIHLRSFKNKHKRPSFPIHSFLFPVGIQKCQTNPIGVAVDGFLSATRAGGGGKGQSSLIRI